MSQEHHCFRRERKRKKNTAKQDNTKKRKMKERNKRNSTASTRHKKQRISTSIYHSNNTTASTSTPTQNNRNTLPSPASSSTSIQIIASSSSATKPPAPPGYTRIVRSLRRTQPANTQYAKKPTMFGLRDKTIAVTRKMKLLEQIANISKNASVSALCNTNLALALEPWRESITETFSKKLSVNEFRNQIKDINNADNETRMLRAKKRNQKIQSSSFEKILRTSDATLETPRPPEPCLPTFQQLQDRQRQLDRTFGKQKIRKRNWRKSLEPDKLTLVEKTLSKRTGLISELAAGGYIQAHDIQKLRPRQWINDEIVTFYTVLINQRSVEFENNNSKPKNKLNGQDENEKFLKTHCFNSFFMPKYDQSGYNGVKRWSKKVDLLSKDIIIFPINIGNAHWTCAAINLRAKRFEYFDSMGHKNPSVLANLRDYIANEALVKKNITLDVTSWPDFYYENLPQQNNSFDCGIFVCQFMDCLSRDWTLNSNLNTTFDFDQSNMEYFRTKMVYEIVTKDFLKEEWN